ncbi:MAG: hypothetical protein ACI8ZM_000468 [Crocinitomix sp.]|jgi:hypothetical protein
MKKIYTLVAALVLSSTVTFAQNIVDASASDAWVAYMNVFDLGGGYQFGSAWEVPAVQTTLDAGENTVTLQPNFSTYEENPGDPFWINDDGSGNKDLEGLTYVEPGGTYNGVDLTFEGSVISHTIDDSYSAQFFIKALDPEDGYADVFGGTKVFDLPASGTFSVEATGAELVEGLIVQYGFLIRGVNASPVDEDSLGSVVIGSVAVSTDEYEMAAKLSVYPNPTVDLISFSDNAIVDSYSIMDIAGQTVLNGTNENSIDVSTLENGIYLIQFTYLDRQKTLKFIKK